MGTSLPLLCPPTLACAKPVRLTSYTELVNALNNGHRVNSIVQFKKCQLTSNNDPTGNEHESMGLSFNQGFFLVMRLKNDSRFAVGTMVSDTVPKMAGGTAIFYKRIRVYDDNSVEVSSILSDGDTSKPIGWTERVCGINQGDDQNGVSLFDYDA